MAPKRARAASARGTPLSRLIVGADAKWAKIVEKNFIPERKFIPSPDNGNLMAQIEERGWTKLATIETRAIMDLVREFYANLGATEETSPSVTVRGVFVSITSRAINEHLGLPSIPDDDYHKLALNPPFDDILATLCGPGALWKRNQAGEPLELKTTHMSKYAKTWAHFVSSNIMPSTHTHGLPISKAVLLYCIVTGRSVNVGKIIRAKMFDAAKCSTTGGLGFGGLITEMCETANVKTYDDEERAPKGKKIDSAFINGLPQMAGLAEANGRGFLNMAPDLEEPARYRHAAPEAPMPEPDINEPQYAQVLAMMGNLGVASQERYQVEDRRWDDFMRQEAERRQQDDQRWEYTSQFMRAETERRRVEDQRWEQSEARLGQLERSIDQLGAAHNSLATFVENQHSWFSTTAEFGYNVYNQWTPGGASASYPDASGSGASSSLPDGFFDPFPPCYRYQSHYGAPPPPPDNDGDTAM